MTDPIIMPDESTAEAWALHAPALAEWVAARMVNRWDAFGHYLPLVSRKPKQTAITDKSGLSVDVIRRHFEGRDRGDIIGLHSTVRDEANGQGESPTCWSRWLAVDVDRHDDGTDPETTREAALTWWVRLRHLGFRPLLFDSDGRGGFHLVTIFDAPVNTARVFRFGKWLIHDWEMLGLTEEPETFPKQASLGRGKGFGNWLRLPGLHHTREHHARVWGGKTWLAGEEAIRAILATEGAPASKIPDSAIEAFEREDKDAPKNAADGPSELELVGSALDSLKGLSGNYSDWVKIGMCLRGLGADGLSLWDGWSQSAPDKYERGACNAKWDSFEPGNGSGLNLGTLFFLAGQQGWKRPRGGRIAPPVNGEHREPGDEGEPVGETFNRTELGNARRLVTLHGDSLRYCHPWSKWLIWDGDRWRLDEAGSVFQFARDVVRELHLEVEAVTDDAARKAARTWALGCEAEKRLNAMVSLCRHEVGIPILPGQLDSNPWLLNCPNGTLNLKTGALGPHVRDDLLMKRTGVAFQSDASCPLWVAFLHRIMAGDETLIGFLRRAAGYALTGSVSEHALFFLYGRGRNGKSTFLNTLLYVLGDYGITINADLLTSKNQDEHPTGVADLHGRRFVSTIEVEDGRRMAESLVKTLTGGDRIRARRMRQDFYEFDPTHKLFLAANHKPTVRGTDEGIWRRIKLIPFKVQIPDSDVDKELGERLKSEGPGVLAWAVSGCLQWQEAGLQEPQAVTEATSEYRAEMDTLAAFLDERCTVDEATKVRAGDLYKSYVEWCRETGSYQLSMNKFGRLMTERGFEQVKVNSVVWRNGIGLLEGNSVPIF